MRGVNVSSTQLRERERGYTLVELLVVLLILVTVVGGIAAAFVSGTNQQATLSRRTFQQTDARLVLDRMRKDIFCSTSSATSLAPQTNGSSGFTLTLSESSTLCPSVVSGAQSSVQWCTVGYAGGTTRYQLYRSASGTCNNTATLIADYLTAPATGWPQNTNTSPTPASWSGNIWPTPSTCAAGNHPVVAIDFNVNRDPTGHPAQGYELRDSDVVRNAATC
jgi:prepilin-type N-terminal cleavage/methylation domain-containing protein